MPDGIVYIDGKDRIEYAIDLLTGAQLWDFDMGADASHKTNSVSCAALYGDIVWSRTPTLCMSSMPRRASKLFRSVAMSGSGPGVGDRLRCSWKRGCAHRRSHRQGVHFPVSNLQELAIVHLSKTKLADSIAISDGMGLCRR